jgi:hypothetical protein
MFLAKYDQCDQIKERERDGTCGMIDREEKNIYKVLLRNLEGKIPFGISRRRSVVNTGMDLKTTGRVAVDWIHLA